MAPLGAKLTPQRSVDNKRIDLQRRCAFLLIGTYTRETFLDGNREVRHRRRLKALYRALRRRAVGPVRGARFLCDLNMGTYPCKSPWAYPTGRACVVEVEGHRQGP